MSQENVEIWRANIEHQVAALTRGTRPEATISKMAEIWPPEVELDATGVPALDLDGVYRGANAVRRFWEAWFSAWETLQFDYELVDAGERVVMLLDMQMRGRADPPREALHEAVGRPQGRRAVAE